MTTITDAHRAEARRRILDLGIAFKSDQEITEILAQALAEPAWQPPVDPDLIEARECAALAAEKRGLEGLAEKLRAGEEDRHWAVQSALIAIKRRQA